MLFLTPDLIISAAVGEDPHHSSEQRVLHGKDLSDKEHLDGDGLHHADYDHEAFLGDEAEEFDNLTPEESVQRLGKIVDKIDKVSNQGQGRGPFIQHWSISGQEANLEAQTMNLKLNS